MKVFILFLFFSFYSEAISPHSLDKTGIVQVKDSATRFPLDEGYIKIVGDCLALWPSKNDFNRFIDCIYQRM